jgi:type II secretory pathway pseudopilin PulG
VEIVVVMAIMAVLMAIAVPNFNKILARHQLDTAARQLAADLRETRERVMTERQVLYKISFDTTNERYFLKKGTSSLRTIELPHQVDLVHTNFDNSKVGFTLSGAPLSPNNLGGTVTLQAGGEFLYVIVAVTGQVRIDDEPPSQ